MGIREDALALADELEAFEDGDCEECSLYGQPECKSNPSCMEVMARYAARKIREAVERDGEGATTVSAYDLLPDDDRKAIAWVREHGGLGAVEKRLMPEGMEWPRYIDGSAVEIGDEVVGPDYGERIHVDAVKFHANGFTFYDKNGFDKWYEDDDRFERSEPKVLDADGVEIRVGDTVYVLGFDEPLTVKGFKDDGRVLMSFHGENSLGYKPSNLTHEQPVLDADGVPIKEGDTVYLLPGEWCDRFPCLLFYGGEELNVLDLNPKYGDIGSIKCCKAGNMTSLCYPKSSQLTHTNPKPPDTYAKLYGDVHDERCGSEEFVRRCRALVEKENINE